MKSGQINRNGTVGDLLENLGADLSHDSIGNLEGNEVSCLWEFSFTSYYKP